MSIADEVAAACAGASAYTLSYGYAVHDEGRRKVFPPCRVDHERRSERGRVTRLEGSYADGSRILFTYAENRGPRLSIIRRAAA